MEINLTEQIRGARFQQLSIFLVAGVFFMDETQQKNAKCIVWKPYDLVGCNAGFNVTTMSMNAFELILRTLVQTILRYRNGIFCRCAWNDLNGSSVQLTVFAINKKRSVSCTRCSYVFAER